MSRQPCESVGMCDSTTESRYSFETQNLSRFGLQMMSTTSSHVPIEHPSPAIKQERVSSPNPAPITLKASTDDCLSAVFEGKGPDSTYPVVLSPRPVSNLPPPYAPSTFDGLTPNHVHSYTPASPHPASPQAVAIDKLQPILSKPVTILGHRTLYQLGLRLDPEMLPAQNWKMMAEYMEFNNWEIKKFESTKSPTMEVIQAWARMGTHTIGDLISILKLDMDRPDVITDIPEYMLKDAARHERSLRKYTSQDSETGSMPFFGGMSSPPMTQFSASSPQFYPSYSQPAYSLPFSSSSPSLYMPSSFTSNYDTYMEKPSGENSSRPVQVDIVQPSEPAVTFDAFVLCNIADKEFVVDRFLPKVEGEAQLKLCFADRDITPGQFAFTDAMNYMFRRSRKLVVILSDEFFESKEHEWQSNLAISRDPASRQQTIIPVKYKKLNNRNIFDYLGCCDLTRTMKEEWFWDKIIKGIKV